MPFVKTYYIKGMHCATCEMLIKQDISKLDGVSGVKVSLAKSQVDISAVSPDKVPSIDLLNKLFKKSGYFFLEQKTKDKPLSKKDVYKVLGVLGLFILLFYFLGSSDVFLKLSLNSQSGPWSYFVFGVAAGISSCAALVGGILLS
ncbi:MAG: cation transporter, partial [Patescibacteria group bacterium]